MIEFIVKSVSQISDSEIKSNISDTAQYLRVELGIDISKTLKDPTPIQIGNVVGDYYLANDVIVLVIQNPRLFDMFIAGQKLVLKPEK
jgi:hypothetical protein